MKELTEYFTALNVLIGIIIATFGSLITFRKKVAELIKGLTGAKNSEAMVNGIKQIEAALFSLNQNIENTDMRISKLEQSLIPINAYVKEKNMLTKLKSAIGKRKTYYITEVPGLDNSIQSLIIEGCEKAYYFFKDIREAGYQNINSEIVNKTAIQIFRTLRSGSGGNINVDSEFKEHVKKNIAMPAIFQLNIKLNKLKSGVFDGSESDVKNGIYNGGSDKELINIAVWFVDEIISKSIQYLNEQKS